mmetsp:Transcript_2742/g.4731  ORF Transcript_2742/g.4731 Transcript_2742/m.4731 type:complete len:325 (-) Transcript_2742:211-1185(-)
MGCIDCMGSMERCPCMAYGAVSASCRYRLMSVPRPQHWELRAPEPGHGLSASCLQWAAWSAQLMGYMVCAPGLPRSSISSPSSRSCSSASTPFDPSSSSKSKSASPAAMRTFARCTSAIQSNLNTTADKMSDWSEAVHAKPVQRPMAPSPSLKARMQEKGRPRPQYMTRLMVAPIFCRPHPRNTPANTVFAPSPTSERARAGTANDVSRMTSASVENMAPNWSRMSMSTPAKTTIDNVPMSTATCVLSHAKRGRDAPSSLPTRVDAAPLRPCAAKKHRAWTLKVIPIILMVISGRGNRPERMTMISKVHQSRQIITMEGIATRM